MTYKIVKTDDGHELRDGNNNVLNTYSGRIDLPDDVVDDILDDIGVSGSEREAIKVLTTQDWQYIRE
ncbi:hypothetical protein OSG_eHP15_00180 [environmental Halophage eHP-15]|nr:hypothetical protein OSG_eHP15_00180 [environmental Halophage eHP-15]